MSAIDGTSLINSIASKIASANRWHELIESSSNEAFDRVSATVESAWNAGNELMSIKRELRESYGHGYWESYVERDFAGSLSTAKRYIRLREKFTHVTDLPCGSLRSVYRQLEIISDNKIVITKMRARPKGRHIVISQQLTSHIRSVMKSGDEVRLRHLRADLKNLQKELVQLFETSPNEL